jgi:hypothetical protein
VASTLSAEYVYGVVDASSTPPRGTTGIAGAPVDAVRFGDVAALVSTVPLPIRAKRRELLSHSEVLNGVAGTSTVVPLRFGTTVADRDSVVDELLRPRHDELRDLLVTLEGRVELMVKAFYREDVVLAEVVRDHPRIARLRARTLEQPVAAAHAERLELGTAVAQALAAKTEADAAAILDVVRPYAVDLRVDETPIEHQVLRASVLVRRPDVPAVDAALSAVAERNAERMVFSYVGPLAPHSFVSLDAAGTP